MTHLASDFICHDGFLLRCLKKLGYFGPTRMDIDPENDNLSEDELFIGSLLNHFLEVLQFNSHEVAQVGVVRVL